MRTRTAALIITAIAVPFGVVIVIWFVALGLAREMRQKIRKGL